MSNPFEGVTRVEFEDIPAYILHYVRHTVEPLIRTAPELSLQLGAPVLVDDILFVLEEIDAVEDRIAQLFVLWTNLISAVARIQVFTAARKQQTDAGISD